MYAIAMLCSVLWVKYYYSELTNCKKATIVYTSEK